jgi:hypothetical protein
VLVREAPEALFERAQADRIGIVKGSASEWWEAQTQDRAKVTVGR